MYGERQLLVKSTSTRAFMETVKNNHSISLHQSAPATQGSLLFKVFVSHVS